MNHTFQMILIMILSGLLSSMSIWADKLSDARLSINDLYMIILMTSWMVFFMSIMNGSYKIVAISTSIIIGTYYAIRKQLFISKTQFYKGMIPHHSMALLMGKRVLEKPGVTAKEKSFIQNIVKTQEDEIKWMKTIVHSPLDEWKETSRL
jgi:hypothetical protein